MATNNSTLTQERLRELLDYNQLTGVFTWRVRRGMAIAGSSAGNLNASSGYLNIFVENTQYKAHRLAWFYVYGVWPTGDIDHINVIRNDNRIANLRDTTRSENSQNLKKARSDNKSGFLGVQISGCKFRAEIRLNGKNKFLGRFNTPEEAHQAYLTAKRELHIACTI